MAQRESQQYMFMFDVWQRGRDGEIAQETGNTFLCNLPLSLGMDGPTDSTPPSDSRLLTDIPDPGARTNPDSSDTSTITMLEVDLFPVYLGEKIKKSLSQLPLPPTTISCMQDPEPGSPASTGAKAVTAPSHRWQMMAAVL